MTRLIGKDFNAAKVTVGGIDISKKFNEYSPAEIAYLVIVYMVNNQNNGVFESSVRSAIKKIWRDADFNSTSSFGRQVYAYLKKFGARSINLYGSFVWELPESGPSQEKLHRIMAEKFTADAVFYTCSACNTPFTDRAELMRHRVSQHGRPKCKFCDEVFDSYQAIAAHTRRSHSEVTKKIGSASKKNGENKMSRKLTPSEKDMLKLLKENPGLSPKEYAKLSGFTSSANASRLLLSLKKKNKAIVTGRTKATKYFPTSGLTTRSEVESLPEATPIEVTAPADTKTAEQPPLPGFAKVWNTTSGETLILGNDGSLYVLEKIKVEV